jgi:hypothetical protein
MHQYAAIYLLQRQTLHVSDEFCEMYILQNSPTPVRIRSRWKEVAVPIPWPIPEVADTVFGTPEDGRCDARNI